MSNKKNQVSEKWSGLSHLSLFQLEKSENLSVPKQMFLWLFLTHSLNYQIVEFYWQDLMKWKICRSCVLAEPPAQRMGQAGSSLPRWPSVVRLGCLFPVYCSRQGLVGMVWQQSGCSGAALCEWREGSVSPSPQGCSACFRAVPSQAGHSKDLQAPAPCCCHLGDLHPGLLSLRTPLVGPR